MRAAHTSVLGESNSAVRKELARFNLISGGLNQLAKLSALLFVDACLQILNLGCVLAHEDDQSNIGDPSSSRNSRSVVDQAPIDPEAVPDSEHVVVFQSMMHFVPSSSPIASM